MKAFLSDLDNTLIYSYKRQLPEDKVLVELMDGKELSYMTAYSHGKLREYRDTHLFIPITTRSQKQYERIFLEKDRIPEYALMANGGILLHNGATDPDWYAESLKYVVEAEDELKKSDDLLWKDVHRSMEVRRVDGLFVFTKSDEPELTAQMLQSQLDMDKVSVFLNGTKVYVLPKGLNKGNAIRRIREHLGLEHIICAGDSLFDIPMLWEADEAIMPEKLYEAYKQMEREEATANDPVNQINRKKVHIYKAREAMFFSDYVLDVMKE